MTPAGHDAERLREKFPSLLRLENAPVVEEADVSLLPKPPVRVEEEVAETGNVAVMRQAKWRAFARSTPQNDAAARPSSRPDRVNNFDAFWPKRRAVRAGRTERPQWQRQRRAAMTSPNAEPETAGAPTPISVLKSGVVDGMAYTLYSDGSIEAQLPQGTLRFGSITELRNHIEQSA